MTSVLVERSLEYVSKSLKKMKTNGYYFHNFEHTLDVFQRVTYLSKKEGINDELQELLQIAAIFHDTGFLQQYDNNEFLGSIIVEKYLTSQQWFFQDRTNFSQIVDNYLKEYDYKLDKVHIIKNLIKATIPFVKPNNNLEKIIKDADIDNFGRDDFFEKGVLLRKELKIIKGIEFDEFQWIEYVYNLFNKLHFYTDTQLKERQKKYLENKEIVTNQYKNNLKKQNSN